MSFGISVAEKQDHTSLQCEIHCIEIHTRLRHGHKRKRNSRRKIAMRVCRAQPIRNKIALKKRVREGSFETSYLLSLLRVDRRRKGGNTCVD
jgi:hypothetical protein